VRINDRGPFHENRVIDLSFAAAKALDFLDTGTANVKIEVIHVDKNNLVTVGDAVPVPLADYLGPTPAIADTHSKFYYIQVVALQDPQRIEQLGAALQSMYATEYQSKSRNNLFRLKLGPFDTYLSASDILQQLHASDYPQAFIVHE
jgi:rare lipoprotein A